MNTIDNTDTATRRPRKTPTERQIERLGLLDPEALIQRACDALHALNRRAKDKRDRAHEVRGYSHRWRARGAIEQAIKDEMATIYDLKTRLLVGLLKAARAKLYSYEIVVDSDYGDWDCVCCGHSWRGGPESSMCYRCDGDGDYSPDGPDGQRWYIVEAGGYRWHQPDGTIPDDLAATAEPTEAHDPTQDRREIPDVGLTIAAQHACIEMAISALAHLLHGDPLDDEVIQQLCAALP